MKYLVIGVVMLAVGVGMLINPYTDMAVYFGIVDIILGVCGICIGIKELRKQ